MKKIITIVIILILVGLGGWYFFSQQEVENEPEETPGVEDEEIIDSEEEASNAEQEEIEVNKNIPYYEKEENAVIPGPNEEKHKILTEVFNSVFEKSKLTSNNAEFDPSDTKWEYWGDMQYFVPDKIDADDVKKVQDKLKEEGFEFTSMDIGAESYFCEYNFELSEETYSGHMVFILGEGEGSSKQGSIDIDFQIRSK